MEAFCPQKLKTLKNLASDTDLASLYLGITLPGQS
jgi:hypothetical protein